MNLISHFDLFAIKINLVQRALLAECWHDLMMYCSINTYLCYIPFLLSCWGKYLYPQNAYVVFGYSFYALRSMLCNAN